MRRCMYCMNEYGDELSVCPECGKEHTSSPLSNRHLMPGKLLNGKYTVGCSLDHNSIFVTYAAWDNEKKEKVLIDEYLPANLSDREKGESNVHSRSGESADKYYAGLSAFADECRDLIKFKNIDVTDGFSENNTFYVVRKIIENGRTLSDLIDNEYEYISTHRSNIIVSIIKTISPIHEAGIIHGNICPDTVIVREDNSVVLTDFAFCGFMSRIIPVYTNEGYSPLEQYILGSRLRVSADVYSIAALYYEMLTGEIPVSALEREKQDTLIPPSILGIKIRPSMENALMNALNIKAENRTQTVHEFYSQLKNKDTVRHWERVKKAEKPPVDFYTKKNFWFKTLIVAMVLLMIFSVVVIAFEALSIKKAAENTSDTEVSTEKIPEEGDSFWDVFRKEEEPEETTELKDDDTGRKADENKKAENKKDDNKKDEEKKPQKDNVTSEAAVNVD